MKITLDSLKKKKGLEKITAITAYDALFSKIFDGEVDLILVGDSLNMSFGGESNTTNISLESMIYHTKAVMKGVKTSFVLADMPFGSYSDKKTALKNAIKFIKETNADALKIEVKLEKLDIVKALIDEGIAIMPHIGLMPQFIKAEGGYKIKGKDDLQCSYLLESAHAFSEAGAFGLLLEGIKENLATKITKQVEIPTIGIGSGNGCDGQILVWSDAFGLFSEFKPKFVREFLNGASIFKQAIKDYSNAVKSGSFPDSSESY